MDPNDASSLSEIKITQSKKESSNWSKTKSCYLVMTTLTFVISLAICVYQTHELIIVYLSNPIETEIKLTINDVMEFPAVTVCNLNPVRRSRWMKMINESGVSGTKTNQALLKSGIRQHSTLRNQRQTKEEYFAGSHTLESFKDLLSAKIITMKNRVKRSQIIHVNEWDDVADENSAKIRNLTAWHDAYSSLESESYLDNEFDSYNRTLKSLESLQKTVNKFETRLALAELVTASLEEDMKETKSYLTSLKVNISKLQEEDGTKTGEVEEEEEEKNEVEKELATSKEMKALNDYLRNIGRMKKKDIQNLGHQKEDFVALCSWQGGICYPSHFHVFQNFIYGNCFTFNTSKVGSEVTDIGPYNGLSLSLFIEQDEYIDHVPPAAGARVVIHDSNYKPFPDEEGFSVAPGSMTAIFLRKSTTTTVKPICDPDIETLHKQSGNKHQYSQKACLKQCLSDEIIRQCECAGGQFLLDMKTCSPDNDTEADCVERLESLAHNHKLPCYCPTPCRSTTYNPMISTASWPAETYLVSLVEELVGVNHKVIDQIENITDFAQYFKKNFLRVSIYFQELTEQEIVQRASYGMQGLLSDVGGQLGLWIGVSVVTLIQTIEITTILAMFKSDWVRRYSYSTKQLDQK